jgi:hypothetical protein
MLPAGTDKNLQPVPQSFHGNRRDGNTVKKKPAVVAAGWDAVL